MRSKLTLVIVLSICLVVILTACADNRFDHKDNKMIVCTEGGKLTLFKDNVDVLTDGFGNLEILKHGKYIASINGGQCIVIYDTKETK